jgi:hypothetical protein
MHRKKMCGNCLAKKFEYEFTRKQWMLPFGRKRWCRDCIRLMRPIYEMRGLSKWIKGGGPERDWTLAEMKLAVIGPRGRA